MKCGILFLMLILMCGLVASEVNDYSPVKHNECVTLKQVCASCSFVNVSLTYPNSTLALSNEPMVNSGGALWTYDFCNTTSLGRYDISGVGDLEGTNTGFDILYFEVSPSGSILNSASSITLFGSLLVMVILYTVVTIQQVLFGFDNIVSGIETLWVVSKIGITIGAVAMGIVVLLIMLKAWRIKRGLDD